MFTYELHEFNGEDFVTLYMVIWILPIVFTVDSDEFNIYFEHILRS